MKPSGHGGGSDTVRIAGFAVFSILLCLAFGSTFVPWVRMAGASDLHSHVILIPAVSVWLWWIGREGRTVKLRGSVATALLPALAGAGLLIFSKEAGAAWIPGDRVSLEVLAWWCFFVTGCLVFLGPGFVTKAVFPLAFLLFMIPLPESAAAWIEGALLHPSAAMAESFLRLAGIPVLRDGLNLQLPGILIEVAAECSGIRSSFVLLILALLVARLFLKHPVGRIVLVLSVVPLGILRNALRIAVIGAMCVEGGPEMIDSWIHRRGGPLFFLLSLIPLVLIAFLLRRMAEKPTPQAEAGS